MRVAGAGTGEVQKRPEGWVLPHETLPADVTVIPPSLSMSTGPALCKTAHPCTLSMFASTYLVFASSISATIRMLQVAQVLADTNVASLFCAQSGWTQTDTSRRRCT